MAAKLNPHIVNWKTMALLLPFLFLPDCTKDILREEGFLIRTVAYWKQLIGQPVYVVVSD